MPFAIVGGVPIVDVVAAVALDVAVDGIRAVVVAFVVGVDITCVCVLCPLALVVLALLFSLVIGDVRCCAARRCLLLFVVRC